MPGFECLWDVASCFMGERSQAGRTRHHHLASGHIGVDEHGAVRGQPPGYFALARPDASGEPDPQHVNPPETRANAASAPPKRRERGISRG